MKYSLIKKKVDAFENILKMTFTTQLILVDFCCKPVSVIYVTVGIALKNTVYRTHTSTFG